GDGLAGVVGAAEETEDARAEAAPPLHVANPVLQYPVEQRAPLVARPVRVTSDEPKHRVLHGVERVVAIPKPEQLNAVRARPDLAEKAFHLERGGRVLRADRHRRHPLYVLAGLHARPGSPRLNEA